VFFIAIGLVACDDSQQQPVPQRIARSKPHGASRSLIDGSIHSAYLDVRLEARPNAIGSTVKVTIYLEGVGGSVAPNGPIQLTLNGKVVHRPFPVWWDIGNWGVAHPAPLGRGAAVNVRSQQFVDWLGGHGAFILQARAGSARSNEVALAVDKSGKTIVLPP